MPPRCPLCMLHHSPDCAELDRIARLDADTVTFVSDTEGTVDEDKQDPMTGTVLTLAGEPIDPPRHDAGWLRQWAQDFVRLHQHESLGWGANFATQVHESLERMWAISTKGD